MGVIKLLLMILRPRITLPSLLLITAWEGYLLLQPKPAELDAPRREVADKACWQAVKRLPKLPAASPETPASGLSTLEPVSRVAVLRLDGDKTGYVTDQLRAVIERTGTYNQPDPSLIDLAMKELKIDESQVGTNEAAMAAGRRMNVPYVLAGRILTFTSDQDVGRIRLALQLMAVKNATNVGESLIVAVPDEGPSARGFTGIWRVATWIAVVILLPLASIRLIRRLLALESNGVTLACLLSYGLLAGLLAFGLGGFEVSGWLSAATLLLAFVAALSYDYHVFSILEKHR